MGIDFVTKCTPTFQRSWDRGREELLEPDLFRRHPQLEGRTFRLSPLGSGVSEGEEVLLQWCASELVAFHEHSMVGVMANPSPALLNAVKEAGGALCARVQHIHPQSGAADISIIP